MVSRVRRTAIRASIPVDPANVRLSSHSVSITSLLCASVRAAETRELVRGDSSRAEAESVPATLRNDKALFGIPSGAIEGCWCPISRHKLRGLYYKNAYSEPQRPDSAEGRLVCPFSWTPACPAARRVQSERHCAFSNRRSHARRFCGDRRSWKRGNTDA